MNVSVLTPTCDRPVGIALAERWMARQTCPPNEWVIVDAGQIPASVTMGQRVIRRADLIPGAWNFLQNVKAGLAAVSGDVIVIWEDDDYYAPTHLERIRATFEAQPRAQIAGDPILRAYHLGQRRWRLFDHRSPDLVQHVKQHASFCQTAFRGSVRYQVERVLRERLQRMNYRLDQLLWESVPRDLHAWIDTPTVVGIKGLPGQGGLGIGHQPTVVARWPSDPDGDQLRAWIGADAEVYLRCPTPGTRAP